MFRCFENTKYGFGNFDDATTKWGFGDSAESAFDISKEIEKYFSNYVSDEDIESKLFNKASKHTYCLKTMADCYFKNKKFRQAFNIYSYLANIKLTLGTKEKHDVYNKIAYIYKNGLGVERASNVTELKNLANERIDDRLKEHIKVFINKINDKMETIEIVKKYCNHIGERFYFDRRLIRIDERNRNYEEKII